MSYHQWHEITECFKSSVPSLKNLQASMSKQQRLSHLAVSKQWHKFREIPQTDCHWQQMILYHPTCSFVSLVKRKITCFCCFKTNKMWRLWPWWLLCSVQAPTLKLLRDPSRWSITPASKPQSPDLSLHLALNFFNVPSWAEKGEGEEV